MRDPIGPRELRARYDSRERDRELLAVAAHRDRLTQQLADEQAKVARVAEAAERLADAIRGLDSYAAANFPAPLERSQRADAALAHWEQTSRELGA